VIDVSGKVINAEVIKSPVSGVFDEPAIAAVSRWEFTPATLNGRRVAVYMQILIEFRLK
ncbi:TonB family protein, partial [bacterium]|nr:TonB family protein [candidate division CSSED10-310 bacterium]